MDDLLTSIVPDNKRKTEVDYQYCIICQENNSESTVVNPNLAMDGKETKMVSWWQMTDKPPAPEAIIEISFCKCVTGCNNMRCKCKKNQLICTELCFCKDCENDNDDISNHLENEEDNDSDDEC